MTPVGEKIFRWDLDKTYLVSHFESLRGLLAVPFEKGADKVALPGVAAVIKGLHRNEERAGRKARVYFLSASPPQIGGAIRDKLEIDGLRYEGITFKHQVSHLVRGRYDALREQIGYKLDRLLAQAETLPENTVEHLFGDDWDSDPFVYSLYADVLARRIDVERVRTVLALARVHRHYVAPICARIESFAAKGALHRVPGIFVLRQRRVAPAHLDALGPRVVWFDNYVECALALYARGLVDVETVVEVARASAFDRVAVAASFTAAAGRTPLVGAEFEPARKRLLASGLMSKVAPPRMTARIRSWWREQRGQARLRALDVGPVPDYAKLVETWSHRRKR